MFLQEFAVVFVVSGLKRYYLSRHKLQTLLPMVSATDISAQFFELPLLVFF